MPATWEGLGAVIVFAITVATALGGVWWRLQTAITALRLRVEEVRSKSAHELAEFKIKAAESFASTSTIKEVEERVIEAVNRLADRLDRILERSGKQGDHS